MMTKQAKPKPPGTAKASQAETINVIEIVRLRRHDERQYIEQKMHSTTKTDNGSI